MSTQGLADDTDRRQRRLFALGTMLAVHAAVLLPLAATRVPTTAQPAIMVGVLAQVPVANEPPPTAAPVPAQPAAPAPVVPPVRLPSVAPVAAVAPATADSIAAMAEAPPAEAAATTPARAAAPATSAAAAADTTATEIVVAPGYHADYLNNPQPPYPLLARRAREEGTVRLRVHVAADGRPTEVLLHAGSGHERLDLAARTTVREWRFVPARRSGQAVAGWVEVPIQFKLEN